ncbi:hypothetical protein [Streptomyces caniscabiei]|uniref:Uncharacterized protein n=1 Tax=Streptomyces caniscabiei TaxID=2746961 RepID=A0ABU4MVV6_9ACTN|nr:hypothetical protein [Streptomyces caniscabiei]MBE4740734.1 hypothetical protein [Streptomyces caniscabiei]MBE4759371.1 hypothetical protein [Streptomyces caniscabiei]MBE4769137.1 hypothetical protein [Streptomyces caniscabiei]MBE4788863.1 hypothetical protein [Streptomyces caniscabiei]MBE4798012.1 hypothetical protein [Streptomyces caniscabiei]
MPQEEPGSRTMSVEGDGLSIGYAVEGASPPWKTYAWYAYDGDETSTRPGAALISTAYRYHSDGDLAEVTFPSGLVFTALMPELASEHRT